MFKKLTRFKYLYKCLQKFYNKLLLQFLQESTIHGLKIFLQSSSPIYYAKQIWILFIITAIMLTHLIIIILIFDFVDQPTEIKMSTQLVHIAKSQFPAIAVCSPNKISKQKLLIYSEKMFKHQQMHHADLLAKTVEEMAENIIDITGFYIYPYDGFTVADERLTRMHNVFTAYYNTTDYPTREILRDLAPDCENIILRGLIFGQTVNTSKLFYKHMTSTSVCCVFNYRRKTYSLHPETRKDYNELIEQAENYTFEGDTVMNDAKFVLQSDMDDFTFTQMSNDAFQIYIFPRDDFAIPQSGSSGEVFVDHSTIVEIPMQPLFVGSSSAIKNFSPKKRQCYFPEEGQKLLNQSYYSFNECLLICRIESLIKYCGCIPPPEIIGYIKAPVCNIIDMPCLTQWKRVWNRWNYFDYVHDEDSQKEVRAPTFENCGHCLPTCDGIALQLYMNVYPLRKSFGEYYSRGLL